ncbi:MAG: phosphoglucosamine mutase [Candidatus Bathyarchaeia archaeon]
MKKRLFGTSGIRGIVNTEITPKLSLQTGLAIATHLNNKGAVTVAHDTRTSSPMLEAALSSGLLGGGCDVLRMGLAPTPVLAYLTMGLDAAAGLMITASHNPPEYNGIKVFNGDSMAYTDEQQAEIQRIIEDGRFRRVPWHGVGSSTNVEETERYVEMVLGAVELSRRWRVAIDPGCGATCHIAPQILRRLGCSVTAINAQPDGFFPGRGPEPTPSSLSSLSRIVRSVGADVGFAYDGDGDRMALVDERGEVSPSDRLLAAYAGHVVRRSGGGVVVTHVGASMCVDEAVEAEGGRVLRMGVGDVNIAIGLRESGALFGGEPVGSWIHPDHHLCPDGILSSVLVLKALEEKGETPSQFVSRVPTYPVLRAKVDCPDQLKGGVMGRLKKRLLEAFPDYKEVLGLDGIRLSLEGGWLLVRPSGTEPVIRITSEAESVGRAEGMMEGCLQTLRLAIKEASP